MGTLIFCVFQSPEQVTTYAGSSYVPAGLTADESNKFRKAQSDKKAANYQRNVAKAGVFEDYTEWYKKRGTDFTDAWKKDVNLGHRMAKTKYDWSGAEQGKKFTDGAYK